MSDQQPRRLTLADIPGQSAPSAPSAPRQSAPQPRGFRRGVETAASAEVSVSRPAKPASEASVKYLRDLVVKKAPWTTEEYVALVIAAGQEAVSKGIVRLQKLPDAPADPNAAGPAKGAAKPAKPSRPNKFPGTCENCGTRVGAEEGTVALADNGKWEVEHLAGECPVSEFSFPVGRYAAAFDGEVHFFHATVDGLFEQAGDTLYPVHGRRAEEVVGQIALDPEVASTTYGIEIEVCGRCGRSLTDTASRAAGIGPVCAKKEW